jgi:hypothetical protein
VRPNTRAYRSCQLTSWQLIIVPFVGTQAALCPAAIATIVAMRRASPRKAFTPKPSIESDGDSVNNAGGGTKFVPPTPEEPRRDDGATEAEDEPGTGAGAGAGAGVGAGAGAGTRGSEGADDGRRTSPRLTESAAAAKRSALTAATGTAAKKAKVAAAAKGAAAKGPQKGRGGAGLGHAAKRGGEDSGDGGEDSGDEVDEDGGDDEDEDGKDGGDDEDGDDVVDSDDSDEFAQYTWLQIGGKNPDKGDGGHLYKPLSKKRDDDFRFRLPKEFYTKANEVRWLVSAWSWAVVSRAHSLTSFLHLCNPYLAGF